MCNIHSTIGRPLITDLLVSRIGASISQPVKCSTMYCIAEISTAFACSWQNGTARGEISGNIGRDNMTRDELVKQLDEDREKRLREFEEQQYVLNLLPQTIVPKYIHTFAYKADAWLIFEVKDRAAAMEIIKVLPPVDLLMVRNGWLSFFPATRLESGDLQRGKVWPISGFTFSVESGVGFSSREISWWTRVGDKLLKVTCRLEFDPTGFSVKSKMVFGEPIYTFEIRNPPKNAICKKFSKSSTSSGRHVFYWPRGTSFEEALLSDASDK